jgi:hypothetical protein
VRHITECEHLPVTAISFTTGSASALLKVIMFGSCGWGKDFHVCKISEVLKVDTDWSALVSSRPAAMLNARPHMSLRVAEEGRKGFMLKNYKIKLQFATNVFIRRSH